MAVTGSGTQQDPYIVENWEDFLSIKSSSIAQYIKFANVSNKVIDFNDIQPEGFDSPITMNGYFDFNGWEFRNMKFNSTSSCFKYSTIEGTTYPILELKNLKLTNFVWDASTSSETRYLFHQVSSTAPTSSNACKVYDVRINGEITTYTNNTIFLFHNMYTTECNIVLNISLINNNSSAVGLRVYLYGDGIQNSNIKIVGTGLMTFAPGSIKNSLIQGKMDCDSNNMVLYFGNNSNSNVILLETSSNISYSGGISIFNNVIAPNVVETTYLKGCTTEQLKDPAYLASIGFNIYGQVIS